MKRMRPLLEEIRKLATADERANYRIPEDPDHCLNAVHMRNIERIYGDQGPPIIELLKRNPAVAIPVIAPRLEQKDREWRKALDDMTNTWREAFRVNYFKSLDHRSFYFKQQDKKTLSSRSMLQEIKDASEKHVNSSEESLATLSAACSFDSKLHAHLEFGFDQVEVHDDVWRVVVRGCYEHLNGGEAICNALRFWRDIYEPVFGLPARPKCEEELQIEAAAGSKGAKSKDAEEKAAARAAAELNIMLAAGKPDMSGSESDDDTTRQLDGEEGVPSTGDAAGLSEADMTARLCRPLSTLIPLSAASAATAAADAARRGHVLYVHDNLYVLFRLHQFLHERLAIARKCCMDQCKTDGQWCVTVGRFVCLFPHYIIFFI